MSHCVLLLLATLRMRANMNIFNIREFCVACLHVWFVRQVVSVPWANTLSNIWSECSSHDEILYPQHVPVLRAWTGVPIRNLAHSRAGEKIVHVHRINLAHILPIYEANFAVGDVLYVIDSFYSENVTRKY